MVLFAKIPWTARKWRSEDPVLCLLQIFCRLMSMWYRCRNWGTQSSILSSAKLHYSYSNVPHRSPAAAARWCQAKLSRNWWCLIQAVARLSTAIQRRKKKDLRCQTPIYCYGLDILRPLFDLLILNISYTTFKRLNWKNCGIKIHKWLYAFNELLIINLLFRIPFCPLNFAEKCKLLCNVCLPPPAL